MLDRGRTEQVPALSTEAGVGGLTGPRSLGCTIELPFEGLLAVDVRASPLLLVGMRFAVDGVCDEIGRAHV